MSTIKRNAWNRTSHKKESDYRELQIGEMQ